MSIGKRYKLLQISTVTLIVLLIVTICFTAVNQKALNESQGVRYKSHLLAQELRQSSDDLTRLARTYVVTGDNSYEKQYWDLLAVRNGQKPRPDGRTVALQTLMKDLGFTPAEFGKLQDAEHNSNNLVQTETIAMNAVKGLFRDESGQFTRHADPDSEMARRIMHDAKYHQDKKVIMHPIGEFETMLEQRTMATVQTYALRGNICLAIVSLLVVCIGALVFVTIRSVNAILHGAVERLKESVSQMAAAADHVAASSEALAQGASEQAASLEETSASTEEINSMTRRNADAAKAVSDLTIQTLEIIETLNKSHHELAQSMDEINSSSDRISKILRVIDEIAFQTNILALNAAVEAARAGEAGMGFAVVADEVRNLAQRCSDASKETATLVEEAVTSASQGKSRLTHVLEAVSANDRISNEVKMRADEVSASSAEQARGLDQIARAVAQMQEVTQRTAATAEESASASEELSSQANGLIDLVVELEKIARSKSDEGASGATRPGRRLNRHSSSRETESADMLA
jgi:methyl-accepting chemotaxis protein